VDEYIDEPSDDELRDAGAFSGLLGCGNPLLEDGAIDPDVLELSQDDKRFLLGCGVSWWSPFFGPGGDDPGFLKVDAADIEFLESIKVEVSEDERCYAAQLFGPLG